MSYNKKTKKYTGYIYLLTCETTGKQYIGLTTVTPYKRWLQHIADAKRLDIKTSKLHNAINKYGEDDFIIEIIKTISSTNKQELKNTLAKLEIEYIKKFNTYPNGYNMTIGGEGLKEKCGEDNPFYGHKHSEETKAKIGKASIIRKAWIPMNTEDATQKMIETKRKNGTLGFSEKARAAAKIANTGRKQSSETIAKRNKTMATKRMDDPEYGIVNWTPDLKLKVSRSRGGKSINQYNTDGSLIKQWFGLYDIKDSLGYDSSSICKCCRGHQNTAYGYKWSYA